MIDSSELLFEMSSSSMGKELSSADGSFWMDGRGLAAMNASMERFFVVDRSDLNLRFPVSSNILSLAI